LRGRDEPTNVLSFPADPDEPRPLGAARLLGDVVVALETVEREARAAGRRCADHLAHMVAHGMLHLLGHDHQDDDAAERMERLESGILTGLGIADPWAATTEGVR
jgi:probable rRNA maturation factor